MKLPRPSDNYDMRIESQRNLQIEQADYDNHKKRQDVEVGDARLIL